MRSWPTCFVRRRHRAGAPGMATLGRVAIDGTKHRTNTSRHKVMSCGWRDRAEVQLGAGIAEILSQFEMVNENEEGTHGDDDGGGGLAAELKNRQRRIEKLRLAMNPIFLPCYPTSSSAATAPTQSNVSYSFAGPTRHHSRFEPRAAAWKATPSPATVALCSTLHP